MSRRALVFGASGQMGSYLCEFLVEKGYDVVGTYFHHFPVRNHKEHFRYERADVCNRALVRELIYDVQWDEIYNMTALMYAPDSWKYPREYTEVNAGAVVNMLACVHDSCPNTKFYQAGSAEIFDIANFCPQNERTPVRPRNPYGVAKAAAQEMVRVYRENQNMFACTGVFFNAESPRRPDSFFAKKTAKGVAVIAAGKQDKLNFGSLGAYRDWGLAEEYVEAAWLMLQASHPQDYVIGTGESHACLEFVQQACAVAGIDFYDKIVYDNHSYTVRDVLQADPSKIKTELAWEAKTKFHDLVRYLVTAEMKVMA